MGFKADIEVFADAGEVSTPDSTWFDNGWLYRHRPERQYWNYRSRRNDRKLNDLQAHVDSLRTAPPQATPNDLCAGFLTYNWFNPVGTPNVLGLGGTIRDSCLGFAVGPEEPFLWILYDDNTIYKLNGSWDYSASPSVDTEESEPAYPTAPDDVAAICADSTHLYVLWSTTGGNYRVSKFASTSLNEVWTADLGYGETDPDKHHMIHADADHIAVSLDNTGFVDPQRLAVIVAKADGAVTSGSGTWVSGSGDDDEYHNAKIVSDGTRVYWISSQDNAPTDRTFYLQSALIAGPTGSGGYSAVELGAWGPSEWYKWPTAILRLGPNIVIASAEGVFYLVDPAGNSGAGALCEIFKLPSTYTPYATGGNAYDVDLSFDGLSVWARLLRQNPSVLQDTMFVQIPAGEFTTRASNLSTPERVFPTVHANINAAVTTYKSGRMHFDGRDLWFIRRGGWAYRITNPGAR